MSLVLIFITKSQFGPSIFFLSHFGLCFRKFDINLVFSVTGTVTVLIEVPRGHVSVLGFFDFFLNSLFIYFF